MHICSATKDGKFLLQRHTMAKRMRDKLRELKFSIKRRIHQPIPVQAAWLASVVRGYFAYYAVPTNLHAMSRFRFAVIALWHKALKRRSQRSRVTWARMRLLADAWIPPVRDHHPWPNARFDGRTQRRSPVR